MISNYLTSPNTKTFHNKSITNTRTFHEKSITNNLSSNQ